MRERTIISIPGHHIVGDQDFLESACGVPGVFSPVGPTADDENRFEVDPHTFGAESERRIRELIEKHNRAMHQ